MQKATEQATEPLIMRVWMCPGGWVVMNQYYELLGAQRGTKRKKGWYVLIPRA